MTLRPVTLREAQRAIEEWHSHHEPHYAQRLGIGIEVQERVVAVVVLEDPKAPALRDRRTWEVTRLCVGPDAPHCAASRLLGAAWRAASGAGVHRLVSYTRQDEDGTCYRAAGWVATARLHGRSWECAHPGRWLPGLYAPSTTPVPRIRWEIGPASARTRVSRVDGSWTRSLEMEER